MHTPHSNLSVELFCDNTDVFRCDADSESEWAREMQSSDSSHRSQSRTHSIDHFSLIEPQYNFDDDLDCQLNQLEPMLRVRRRWNDAQAEMRRCSFGVERFPAQLSFGFSFGTSPGLYKRDNLNNDELNEHEPVCNKSVKQDTQVGSVLSDCDKQARSDTKPFTSDNISLKSYHSDCSTLKFGDRVFVEQCGKRPTRKYQNLDALHQILRKLFKGRAFDRSELNLQPHELTILRAIISRKFKNKVHIGTGSFFLSDKLNEIQARGSNKRSEECYKFIFKRCIKSMRDQFKRTRARKGSKSELERRFYEFHFGEIAKKEGIALEGFFQPTNSLKQYAGMPKTINAVYMNNICRSEVFVAEFLDYAHNRLRFDYENIIDSKIEYLMKKWDAALEVNRPRDEIMAEITSYIEKNRKCKLPWSLIEVDDALVSLKKLFKEHEAGAEKRGDCAKECS